MTITVNDVKLLKSQRLTDESDGGGRATGDAIVDNEINNLFPDISRLDRTLGRINMRKVFAGVVTENQDRYLGAHCIVTRKPGDDLVHALMFNTGSQTDEREEARGFVEGYVVPSTAANFDLLGDQFAGQRALTCIQHDSLKQPEVGDVYQLVDGFNSQYVRIDSISAELREFLYDYGNGNWQSFVRRYLTLGISAPLGVKYPGGQPTPSGTSNGNLDGKVKARVLATQVADAARYYGISPLAVACSAGDLQVRVQSVYSQLVPSGIKENALVDQVGGARKAYNLAASATPRSVNLTFVSVEAGESRTFLSTGAARGSVTLVLSGATYKDDGSGELRLQSGSAGLTRATVDYETGLITAYRASPYTGSAIATYIVAAAATGQTVTGEIEIKLGNRGFAYTLNLSEAKPRPGTLSVSYMALGRWYELRDLGSGELMGEGTGSINFASGAVSVTFDAMPDVDTAIIYNYVAQADFNFKTHEGAVDAPQVKIAHELQNTGINPVGVIVKTVHGGITKTMTSTAGGEFSSDVAAGYINGAAGILTLLFTVTPDVGSSINVEYESGVQIDVPLTLGADGGGITTGTIPGAPLKPGSVWLRWTSKRKGKVPVFNRTGSVVGGNQSATVDEYETESLVDREVRDDGVGNWVGLAGSINYATGDFSVRTEAEYQYSDYYVNFRQSNRPELGRTASTKLEQFSGTLLVRAQDASVGYGTTTEDVPAPQVELALLPSVADAIVPGSLLFQWGAEQYIDRDGILYKNIDSKTNAGIAVGSVDYAGRTARLATWPANSSAPIERLACLTAAVGFSTTYLFFRTPGSPLRPASMQITAVRTDTAEVITAMSDINGKFNSGVIHGEVDAQTGIARIVFTNNPEDLTGASDVQVISSLIRYNAVVQTSLPMSAELLGLDPVRLPADGRVPIYRDGDVLVIHHTGQTVISPVAGDTVVLNRQDQAEIYVIDSKENRLDPAQYSVDREAGTLTWANPVLIQDEGGEPLTPPLTICDRVEHMTVCTEAQITGLVSINSPMPWDMPAAETFVSSALTWGDMQARLYRWFTQKTWSTGTPNWTDFPIGDQTTAQYNQLNYPPVVANMGSISGKWALVFTDSTSFQIVEEKLGVIAVGNIANDSTPMNPATNTPYFTIRKQGWGSGWAAGNAVRFNTDACLGPAWVVRTVLAGKGTVKDDNFRLQVRGDAD